MGKEKQNIEWFDTIVGKSVHIDGRLVVGKSVRLDGTIVGDIEKASTDIQPTVAVGKTGKIEGNIKSHKVIVAGTVVGNIYAEEQVILNSTSTVKGDVSYKSLSVEEGAEVLGSMIKKDGIKVITQSPLDLFNDIFSNSKGK